MVEVSVRQDDCVDRICGNGQRLPIVLAPLLHTLEEPTIHQHLRLPGVDEVLRAGDAACRAEKLDVCHALTIYLMSASLSFGSVSGTLPSFTRACVGLKLVATETVTLPRAGTCTRATSRSSPALTITGTTAPAPPLFAIFTSVTHFPSSVLREAAFEMANSGNPRSRYTQSEKNHPKSLCDSASTNFCM